MKKDKDSLGGVLGNSVRIQGEIVSENSLRFDGELQGTLVAKGGLIMGADGLVRGKILGTQLQIAGRVEGDIVAVGQLEILRGAEVTGNVYGLQVAIHEGARVKGQCSLGESSTARVREEQKAHGM